MNRRGILTLCIALVALLFAGWLSQVVTPPRSRSSAPAPKQASQPKAEPKRTETKSQPEVSQPGVGFASRQKLVDHYGKHGHEFGKISMDEYLRRAQALREKRVSDKVLELVRRDRVITRFDVVEGDFLAFESDGTIRTFFKPNDGVAYFYRQAKR